LLFATVAAVALTSYAHAYDMNGGVMQYGYVDTCNVTASKIKADKSYSLYNEMGAFVVGAASMYLNEHEGLYQFLNPKTNLPATANDLVNYVWDECENYPNQTFGYVVKIAIGHLAYESARPKALR